MAARTARNRQGAAVRVMAPTESFDPSSPELARRRLTRRLVASGVIIVVLLGALAMFDRMAQMEPEEPLPAKAAKTEPPPAQPIGPSVRTDGQYPVGAPPPPPIQPTVAPAPAVEPPPKPEVAADPAASVPATAAPVVPVPPVRPASRPASRPPAVPATAAAPVAVDPVPEGTTGGEIKPAPASAAAVPTTAARPLIQQLRRGYVLQAGVFTSTERAEEMRARLAVAGVPVTIESRVQVGPFASAQEAAAAREKIKALGIESIVIPPARSRAAGR